MTEDAAPAPDPTTRPSDGPSADGPSADGGSPSKRHSLNLLLLRAGLVLLVLGLAIALVWDQLVASGPGGLGERIAALMVSARESSMAPLIALAILVVLNISGVPLMVLTAGTTIVFDQIWQGFLLSWSASMIGAVLGFGLGHLAGSDLLRRFAGDRINAFSALLGRRGILACFVVRLIPTAPAIVVNMAIGASHVGLGKFMLGTALGIAPKLAFIAAVTKGIVELEAQHSVLLAAGLAALVVLWIGSMIIVRRLVLSSRTGQIVASTAGGAGGTSSTQTDEHAVETREQ